jgi:hypothetical protein
MFLTQIYGTVLGGFVNYGVMISIVNGNRDLLVNSNGNASWSGATIQSYNTNAASWALAKYLYKSGADYEMVPIGLAIGAGLVVLHRALVYVSVHQMALLLKPTDNSFSLSPKFEVLTFATSTCPSSSSTPATSHITSPRPASSGASLLLVSSPSTTSETTALASSRTIRT